MGTGIPDSAPVFEGRTGKYRYQKYRKSVLNIFRFGKFDTGSKPIPGTIFSSYHMYIF
ncbi:hypothetical protein Hanom_Chr03g00227321 [Helianthus anomalus]